MCMAQPMDFKLAPFNSEFLKRLLRLLHNKDQLLLKLLKYGDQHEVLFQSELYFLIQNFILIF